jgi:uncharacterized protein YutE (UPF0331/DUF86 family)/predicted nucleotidyltransferase
MEVKHLLVEVLRSIEKARRIHVPRSEVEESALRWELYAAVQSALDALAMIVSDLGLRKPSSYADLGNVLFESGILDASDRDFTVKLAKLRNTLAHAYRKLTVEELRAIVEGFLPGLEGFVNRLLGICESRNLDPSRNAEPKLSSSLRQAFEKHGVVVAYLFGSRARGTAREDSDYDIAVVFEKPNPTILDEIELCIEVARSLGVAPEKVDVVALNNADALLKARVLREGVLIYARSEQDKKKWERRTLVEVLDELELQALYLKRALRSG